MKRNVIHQLYSNVQTQIITKIWIEYNGIKMEVRALWDTGSEICIMSPRLQKKLSFPLSYAPETNDVIYTIDNKKLEYVKYGWLTYCINKTEIKSVMTTAYPLTRDDYDLLIGMPIINRGIFKIDNSLGFTNFTFKVLFK